MSGNEMLRMQFYSQLKVNIAELYHFFHLLKKCEAGVNLSLFLRKVFVNAWELRNGRNRSARRKGMRRRRGGRDDVQG